MGKPLRVLIVEDSEDDALLLLHELEGGGYDLTYERVDTREAMAQALERQTWDIVLADYSMPSFNGLAALLLLKEKDFGLPFIVVSGKIGEELAVELMKAGAHDFIVKGNLKRLNVAIERELKEAQVRRECKQAEEALRCSEERLRAILKNMLNGYAFCKMLFDAKNRPDDFIYIEVNDAFVRLTGLRKEDVIGKRVTEAIPSIRDLNPEIINIYGEVVLTGRPTAFEVFFKPLGIWLTISVFSPQKDHFVAVFDNITERKQAEEVLIERSRELERRVTELEGVNRLNLRLINERLELLAQVEAAKQELEAIFDTIPDGIVMIDGERRIRLANQGFARLVGKPVKEVLGEIVCRLLHGRDEPIHDCPMERAKSTGRLEGLELREPHLGGKHLDARVYPMPGWEKPRFVHLFRVTGG